MAQTDWQLLPEWHPQLGTLLAWPHANTDWAHNLEAAQQTYLHVIDAICATQNAWLIVPNQAHQNDFEAAWQAHQQQKHQHQEQNQEQDQNQDSPTRLPNHLNLITAPYNDTWLRDSGPLTLSTPSHPKGKITSAETDPSPLKLISFRFNGWGNKFAHEQDAQLATHLCKTKAFAHPHLDHATFEALSIIAEGGNLETNGTGILMTQRHCLLHPNRNPKMDQEDWEALIKEKLGLHKVWWLASGQIEGDDTDGHIDTLARFCSANHIVYQSCDEADYPYMTELMAMAEQLRHWQSSPDYHVNGKPITLTALPWPDAIYNNAGERLPATYANFLIINNRVLMPTYGVPQDTQALAVLSHCFPNRTVLGIPCRALIEQGGSLHCITMQISAPYG